MLFDIYIGGIGWVGQVNAKTEKAAIKLAKKIWAGHRDYAAYRA